MRSSLSSRSLHFALGVTVGSLEPRPLAASRLRCFLPTRGGGAGGSHFFFFSYSSVKQQPGERRHEWMRQCVMVTRGQWAMAACRGAAGCGSNA